MVFINPLNLRDLCPVEGLDPAEGDAEVVALDERHSDVAVVEEARLVLQDVLRQQLRQLQRTGGFLMVLVAFLVRKWHVD